MACDIRNLLLSFTVRSTSCRVPSRDVSGKYWFIFGVQWIFAILAPSGNGLQLSGMPDLKASIISGLARMTATSLRLALYGVQRSNLYKRKGCDPTATLSQRRITLHRIVEKLPFSAYDQRTSVMARRLRMPGRCERESRHRWRRKR